mmetsp:Transcript_43448/g.125408  ORF Transcript_43448/g.125408 Transcript_43448/m.125408 type:complete len:257 (+) Transcript_43448:413-1183(+)
MQQHNHGSDHLLLPLPLPLPLSPLPLLLPPSFPTFCFLAGGSSSSSSSSPSSSSDSSSSSSSSSSTDGFFASVLVAAFSGVPCFLPAADFAADASPSSSSSASSSSSSSSGPPSSLAAACCSASLSMTTTSKGTESEPGSASGPARVPRALELLALGAGALEALALEGFADGALTGRPVAEENAGAWAWAAAGSAFLLRGRLGAVGRLAAAWPSRAFLAFHSAFHRALFCALASLTSLAAGCPGRWARSHSCRACL